MEATQLPTPPHPIGSEREATTPSGPIAAVLLGSLGLLIALYFIGAPLLVLALPLLIVGTMAAVTRPVEVIALALLVSGFIGTIIAFLGLPVDAFAGALVLCLWLAVIVAHATGRVEGPTWLLPALIPLGLYVLISLVQMLASESLTYAFADFRITIWYMGAVLLLALAPWDSRAFKRIALGFVVISLLVGLYALYRYIFGPSVDEYLLARGSVQRVVFSTPVRFFGSFLSAFQLAAWCGVALPVLLAMSFVTKGRWRAIAILALGLCAFATFASEVRTGLVAGAAGMATVMALFILSRAFAVQRIAATFFAVLGIATLGGIAVAVVIPRSTEGVERFERIFTPTDDLGFQNRLSRWEIALDVIDEEPLGYGLGTQGVVGQGENPDGQIGPFNLDSAYLKVGIQQGYLVMILFAVAQLALLVGIALRAIRVRDRWRCALGIGACGALVAQMILFVNGIYSEGVTALAAWVVIGLGVAQFSSGTRRGERPQPPAEPGQVPEPEAALA